MKQILLMVAVAAVSLASSSAHAYIDAYWAYVRQVGPNEYLHEQLRFIDMGLVWAISGKSATPELVVDTEKSTVNSFGIGRANVRTITNATKGFPCSQFDDYAIAVGLRCVEIPIVQELSICPEKGISVFSVNNNDGMTIAKCVDGKFYFYDTPESRRGLAIMNEAVNRAKQSGFIVGQ